MGLSSDKTSRSDKSVLITGARAPVALHAARLFHQDGWRVIMADTPRHPVSAASTCCGSYYQLPSPRYALADYADAMDTLLVAEECSLVVPTCEEIFYLARIWQERNFTAELFAPDLPLLEEVHNKDRFIKLCKHLDLPTPETRLLQSRADLDTTLDQCASLVYKPAWSRFADRVLIQPKAGQLSTIIPSPQEPWVAQHYLEGEEICAYGVARNGHLLALGLYHSSWRAGKGAGIYFDSIRDQASLEFVQQFVAKTAWTGQISFDLMRLRDGSILPLECNPRTVSGLHLFRRNNPLLTRDTGTLLEPDMPKPQMIKLAMWIYALPAAIKSGKTADFFRSLNKAEDVMSWPYDPLSKSRQLKSFVEILTLAARKGITPQQASTRDIEWNGNWCD